MYPIFPIVLINSIKYIFSVGVVISTLFSLFTFASFEVFFQVKYCTTILLTINLPPSDIVVAKTEFLEIYKNIENRPHTRNIIDNTYFIDNIIVRVWAG